MLCPKTAQKNEFLVKLALEKGAADAKIISASQVVIEDRVVLKCRVGYNHYGETLACPPIRPQRRNSEKSSPNTATPYS
jgi:predicted metal-binding protein